MREKVGEVRYRSRSPQDGRPEHTLTHTNKVAARCRSEEGGARGRAGGWVRVRGCLESAGLRVVRTKAA